MIGIVSLIPPLPLPKSNWNFPSIMFVKDSTSFASGAL